MKIHNRLKALCLIALILCFAFALSACGDSSSTDTPAGDPAYKVTVVDPEGTPYTTGVIVRFCQGGEQVAMVPVDGNGVAEKELAAGEYTVELMFTGSGDSYYYDTAELTLTAEKHELTVVLYGTATTNGVSLYANGEEHVAYYVETGTVYVELTNGARSYFLFKPVVSGTYRFTTSDADAKIGYYGAPHFVQSNNVAEVVDNAFTVSVSQSMIGTGDAGTTVLVLGVDSAGVENCLVTVERIGDAETSISDMEWTIYEATAQLAPFVLEDGLELVNFDITADSDAYTLVYNESDGFYHLNTENGPLVYVRLGTPSDYLDSIQVVLDNSDINRYFYDEDGNFLWRERYTDCLLEYIQYMDEDSGVYPLTEDLKYIIQQRGEFIGWWDTESPSFLFENADGLVIAGFNADIAWLFLCCYAQ